MSDVVRSISFPLDEGYFRRACPFCIREFKILLSENDLTNYIQKIVDHYMETIEEEQDNLTSLFYCPYCGQSEENNGWNWMTKEQETYVKTHIENIALEAIDRMNKELKRTLNKKPSKSGFISIGFKYEPAKIVLKNAWIRPETNDMKIFNLPCCETSMKILNEWEKKTHCYLCGFPHNMK